MSSNPGAVVKGVLLLLIFLVIFSIPEKPKKQNETQSA